MRRKVIKQGHNTLTITLPSKWAKRFKINAGDEIEFEETENSLKIISEKNADLSSTIVDITDLSIPLIWRFVSSAYRAGYDEIRIRWEEKNSKMKNFYSAFSYDTLNYLFENRSTELSPLETIQALINRFVGVEIIDQRANYCVVKELGETSYKEFDNSLRRIFLLILSMGEECEEAVKGNNADLKAIHLTDTNLDRFEDFCFRVLNKKKYVNPKKTPTVYSMIFLLELIGDEYKRFSVHLLKQEGEATPTIQEYLVKINKQFRNFYDLYYSFKKEKIREIYEVHSELELIFHTQYKQMSCSESEFYHHLRKISRFILSLVELRIDLEF